MEYSDYGNLVRTPQMWADICGLTQDDIPTQVVCFWEEVQEFNSAVSDTCMLDGLVDSLWVRTVLGHLGHDPLKLLEMDQMLSDMHFAADFDYEVLRDGCNEVTNSNFSKFCMSTTTADISVLDYRGKGVQSHWVKRNYEDKTWYVIQSSEDQTVNGKFYPKGKILKGLNYFEPDLMKIVNRG